MAKHGNRKALREFVEDLANHGLRFDLNPTHKFKDMITSETFWHEYAKRMDLETRKRAQSALDKSDS